MKILINKSKHNTILKLIQEKNQPYRVMLLHTQPIILSLNYHYTVSIIMRTSTILYSRLNEHS